MELEQQAVECLEVAKALVATGMVEAAAAVTELEVVEAMARATVAEPRGWVEEWKVVAALGAAMVVAAAAVERAALVVVAAAVVERVALEEARHRSQGGVSAAVAPRAAPRRCSP